VHEGKVHGLAVSSAQRYPGLEQIPTVAESGVPGYELTTWNAVYLPAGTPRPIVDKLNGVLMPYLKRPDVRDRLQAVAIEPRTSTPDEMKAFLASEIVKWARVVKDAGIQPQ
jgi:tripartite-type tricarboxylate transporter receptor subunit TctC